MDQRFLEMSPQPWAQVGLLLGFCVIVYFVHLGQWDLGDPVKPRGKNLRSASVQTSFEFSEVRKSSELQLILRRRVGDRE